MIYAACTESGHNDGLRDKKADLSSEEKEREISNGEFSDERGVKRQKQKPLPTLAASQPDSFLTLPTDVQLLVFNELTLEEAFFLALTSQNLWSVGRGHLLRF